MPTQRELRSHAAKLRTEGLVEQADMFDTHADVLARAAAQKRVDAADDPRDVDPDDLMKLSYDIRVGPLTQIADSLRDHPSAAARAALAMIEGGDEPPEPPEPEQDG